ncbi:MAG: hypothetical protein ACYTFI_03165 [Planctomycetota bacterium]
MRAMTPEDRVAVIELIRKKGYLPDGHTILHMGYRGGEANAIADVRDPSGRIGVMVYAFKEAGVWHVERAVETMEGVWLHGVSPEVADDILKDVRDHVRDFVVTGREFPHAGYAIRPDYYVRAIMSLAKYRELAIPFPEIWPGMEYVVYTENPEHVDQEQMICGAFIESLRDSAGPTFTVLAVHEYSLIY